MCLFFPFFFLKKHNNECIFVVGLSVETNNLIWIITNKHNVAEKIAQRMFKHSIGSVLISFVLFDVLLLCFIIWCNISLLSPNSSCGFWDLMYFYYCFLTLGCSAPPKHLHAFMKLKQNELLRTLKGPQGHWRCCTGEYDRFSFFLLFWDFMLAMKNNIRHSQQNDKK